MNEYFKYFVKSSGDLCIMVATALCYIFFQVFAGSKELYSVVASLVILYFFPIRFWLSLKRSTTKSYYIYLCCAVLLVISVALLYIPYFVFVQILLFAIAMAASVCVLKYRKKIAMWMTQENSMMKSVTLGLSFFSMLFLLYLTISYGTDYSEVWSAFQRVFRK